MGRLGPFRCGAVHEAAGPDSRCLDSAGGVPGAGDRHEVDLRALPEEIGPIALDAAVFVVVRRHQLDEVVSSFIEKWSRMPSSPLDLSRQSAICCSHGSFQWGGMDFRGRKAVME